MTSAEMAKLLWDLANAITGFAVVQGLIFAYACAKKEVADVFNRKALKLAIAVMVTLIGAGQCAAVRWCGERRSTPSASGAGTFAPAYRPTPPS